jgi:hypothetical protein
MPFKLKVVWGEDEQITQEYTFRTRAEREAFVKGVNEAVGWNDADMCLGEDKQYETFPKEENT